MFKIYKQIRNFENLKTNVKNEKILDQLTPFFLEPCIINFIFRHRPVDLRYTILDLPDTHLNSKIQNIIRLNILRRFSYIGVAPSRRAIPTALVCRTSGKPSTRLPLGGLVE